MSKDKPVSSDNMDVDSTQSNSIMQKQSDYTSVKRTSYNGLVIVAIVGIALGSFFAGYFVFSMDSADYVTSAELDVILRDFKEEDRPVPSTDTRLIVSADDDPVLGDANAPVTIVEFSDFECPFCARFHQQTLPQIVQNYVDTGLVNIVYRDFPLDAIHPNAIITHMAAECAHEQSMFWPYHDMLFERQEEWNNLDAQGVVNKVVEYAQSMPLDMTLFVACMDNPETSQEVYRDKQAGVEYGVTGTPAFFIGNDQSGYILVSGAKPYESFVSDIEQKLES